MRSNKRYTNATFTKRVDHEAGRHHTLRAESEPIGCPTCGAIYRKRRWVAQHDSKISNDELRSARVKQCPGVQAQKGRRAQRLSRGDRQFFHGPSRRNRTSAAQRSRALCGGQPGCASHRLEQQRQQSVFDHDDRTSGAAIRSRAGKSISWRSQIRLFARE